MDPLSMTASIIAVLQLTATLTTYLNDVRNANSDQKRLAIEASNLFSLLTNLRFRVEEAQTDDVWFNQVKLLSIHEGPLDQFKHMLEKIVEQISPSGTRDRVKSALTWKFTKSGVNETLTQMERVKSLINIALTNDAFKLSQAIYGDLTDLTQQTQEIQLGVDRLENHANRDLQERLSRWLRIPDPSINYQAARKKRQVGTGSWLLMDQRFTDWKTSSSSFIWLHGSAGCGKTVLSATATEDIIQESTNQRSTAVSYFYFDFNDTEKQRPHIAARSLLFQFALQIPATFQALEHLYQQCRDGQQQPAEDQIRNLIICLVAQGGQKYVVLDALDECNDREEILTLIQEMMTVPQNHVCILATSRQERDIDLLLTPIADCIINIQSTIVDADIGVYVRHRLEVDEKLKKWTATIKGEIAAELMKKANGMFRWAYCQLESLRNCVKLSALKKTLSLLPKGLDETYARIIQDLDSNDQLPDAVKVLQWLCFCNRPMSLAQLVEMLAIENGRDGAFSPEERLPDPFDLMQICSSLISCEAIPNHEEYQWFTWSTEHDANRQSKKTQVRLAHFSVKEYLLSDRCSLRSKFQSDTCHAAITESCLHYLQYLSRESVPERVAFDEYPLANYAARRWWLHALDIDSSSNTKLIDFICDYLMNRDNLTKWRQLSGDTGQQPAGPLYYAAAYGLTGVVERIIGRGAEVNARGGSYGNALQAALNEGHDKVAQLLLDRGADVNVQGGYYGTVLQAAAEGGHEKMVQILLDRGADVNAEGGYHGSALQAASQRGHENIVQILLDRGANVDAGGGACGNVLQAASHGGHESIVQILLDRGANIDAQGGYYSSALQMASMVGHEKTVQLLLDRGADVNAQGGADGTALQVASHGGRENIVLILLDHGADVNAQGRFHGSALQAASERGHEKIVQLLLDRGADVDAGGGYHGSALQAALFGGHKKILQMLLDRGADVNAQGRRYGSALQAASLRGQEELVRLLLDYGADVGAGGGHDGSALQAASERGHEKTVQLLLDRGADVDAGGGRHGSALQAALSGGHKEIVQMLISAGAKSDLKES